MFFWLPEFDPCNRCIPSIPYCLPSFPCLFLRTSSTMEYFHSSQQADNWAHRSSTIHPADKSFETERHYLYPRRQIVLQFLPCGTVPVPEEVRRSLYWLQLPNGRHLPGHSLFHTSKRRMPVESHFCSTSPGAGLFGQRVI